MTNVFITTACIFTSIINLFSSIFGGVTIKPADERLKENTKVIVASYNTAAPWGDFLKGTGSNKRAKQFAQQINDLLPDSLGVQEINSNWVEKMEEYLPQYDYYGVKRGGDKNEKQSEMNGIFYLKDKFLLMESGTLWISDTPDVESRFEGAGCHRIISHVVLKNKTTGKMYVHINTHLDNTSIEAQTLGGQLLTKKVEEIKVTYGEIPVVITGDFNQYSDGEACVALKNIGFTNANSVVENGDNMVTYNGWTNETRGRPIDFIFVNNGFTVTSYQVVSETGTRNNVSDHYMIKSLLNIN